MSDMNLATPLCAEIAQNKSGRDKPVAVPLACLTTPNHALCMQTETVRQYPIQLSVDVVQGILT
jgi:hypothetical protein